MNKPKSRHLLLTIYLLFIIVLNTGMFIFMVMNNIQIFFLIISLLNIVFPIALFMWKKWAFWGQLCNSIIIASYNIYIGTEIVSIFIGLSGIIVLFGLLHIGKDRKAWPQLV